MNSRAWHVEWQDAITQFAWPMLILKDGVAFNGGTAVVVAPFYALTARHCFETAWKLHRPDYLLPNDPRNLYEYGTFNGLQQIFSIPDAGFSIIAYQVKDAGEADALIWAVDKLWLSPLTDIALLHFTRPKDLHDADFKVLEYPQLALYPPGQGTLVQGFGYPDFGEKLIYSSGLQNRWMTCRPFCCEGEILPDGASAISQIHFSVGMPFVSGQSGGPIFTQDKQVCGIISGTVRDNSTLTEEATYLSQCAPLWPSMSMLVDQGDKKIRMFGFAQQQLNMPELANQATILQLHENLLEANNKYFSRHNITHHLSIATDYLVLAALYHDLGKLEDSSDHLYRALEIAWSDNTPDHNRITNQCLDLLEVVERKLRGIFVEYIDGSPIKFF